MTIAEGRFSLPAYVRPHRIVIESIDHGGIVRDDETTLAELPAGKLKPARNARIPAIYNTRSTLERTIRTDSPKEFRFTLVTRP
jgi:hypothetical protein